MTPSNSAAWLTANGQPLEVRPAEYTPPGEKEIVIKNATVALNLVDWFKRDHAEILFPSGIKYPTILGTDVAGEVVEVGSDAETQQRFKVGDRVLGFATSFYGIRAADGAFQQYVVLQTSLASPIPSSLSYKSAAVLPMGLATAAAGLFQKDTLALNLPAIPAHPFNGETVLIWGGSTSVGSNAIQLAVAAGYEVITTASPKNFEYVKKLGANQAFDYNSSAVVPDIVTAFKGKNSAGAFAIGVTAPGPCIEIVDKIEGGKKFVALSNRGPEEMPDGVTAKFFLATELRDNGIGVAIFVDYLPRALAEGKYVAAPKPEVVGKGLEAFQKGLDTLKEGGVSAKKLVISL